MVISGGRRRMRRRNLEKKTKRSAPTWHVAAADRCPSPPDEPELEAKKKNTKIKRNKKSKSGETKRASCRDMQMAVWGLRLFVFSALSSLSLSLSFSYHPLSLSLSLWLSCRVEEATHVPIDQRNDPEPAGPPR